MTLVKMFDFHDDIYSALKEAELLYDAYEYFEFDGNRSLGYCWRVDANSSIDVDCELEVVLNKFFIQNGCDDKELVYIWYEG